MKGVANTPLNDTDTQSVLQKSSETNYLVSVQMQCLTMLCTKEMLDVAGFVVFLFTAKKVLMITGTVPSTTSYHYHEVVFTQ